MAAGHFRRDALEEAHREDGAHRPAVERPVRAPSVVKTHRETLMLCYTEKTCTNVQSSFKLLILVVKGKYKIISQQEHYIKIMYIKYLKVNI